MTDAFIDKHPQIGDFILEKKIGKGSVADVYKARHIATDEPVALKVMKPDFIGHEVGERFLAEINLLKGFDHPNIIKSLASGEVDQRLYYAMEYVESGTLAELCRKNRFSYTFGQILHLIHQIANALEYVHARDIIHRDLKPDNILMRNAEHPLVTDFGIARDLSNEMTMLGESFGTPAYMSPEQAVGGRPGPKSDQYALGVITYWLFTGGQLLFDGNTKSVMQQHESTIPKNPSLYNPQLPAEFDAIIQKTLEKRPNDRYDTCLEFYHDLEYLINIYNLSALPIIGTHQPQRPRTPINFPSGAFTVVERVTKPPGQLIDVAVPPQSVTPPPYTYVPQGNLFGNQTDMGAATGQTPPLGRTTIPEPSTVVDPTIPARSPKRNPNVTNSVISLIAVVTLIALAVAIGIGIGSGNGNQNGNGNENNPPTSAFIIDNVTATDSPPTSTRRPPTSTPSDTPTLTLTFTLTPTHTPTATNTPSSTPTSRGSILPANVTPSPTFTATNTPTATSTPTSTPTFTLTPSNTPTSTPTATHTRTPLPTTTPTLTATATASPTVTLTQTATNTPTPAATALPAASALLARLNSQLPTSFNCGIFNEVYSALMAGMEAGIADYTANNDLVDEVADPIVEIHNTYCERGTLTTAISIPAQIYSELRRALIGR